MDTDYNSANCIIFALSNRLADSWMCMDLASCENTCSSTNGTMVVKCVCTLMVSFARCYTVYKS